MSLRLLISHTMGTRIAQSATNFLLAFLLARWLGPEGKGFGSLLMLNLTFIVLVQNLFGGGALVYLIPKHGWSRLKNICIGWAVISSLVIALIIHFISDAVIQWYWLFLIGVFQNLATSYQHVLIAQEKIKQANWQTLAQAAISLCTALLIFYFYKGFSIPFYALCLCLGFLASLLIGLKHHEQDKGPDQLPAEKPARALLNLGLYSQAANLFQLANYRLSYYFIERLFTVGLLGIYSIIMNLADLIWMPSRSLATILYSRIANSSSNAERLADLRLFSWLCLGFTGLGCLVLGLLPDTFYQFVFGEGFVGIQEASWYIIPGIFALGSANGIVHYFNGIGLQRINMISSALGLLITSVGLIYLLPSMGLKGAAITCSISYCTSAFLLIIVFFKKKGSE